MVVLAHAVIWLVPLSTFRSRALRSLGEGRLRNAMLKVLASHASRRSQSDVYSIRHSPQFVVLRLGRQNRFAAVAICSRSGDLSAAAGTG